TFLRRSKGNYRNTNDMEHLVAGATAALLTLFDLDRVFYIPSRVQQKLALSAWRFGFILVIAVWAALFYQFIVKIEAFDPLNAFLKAVLFGVGYLGLVRLKFATFDY